MLCILKNRKNIKELEVFAIIYISFQIVSLISQSVVLETYTKRVSHSLHSERKKGKKDLLKQILGPHNAMDRF